MGRIILLGIEAKELGGLPRVVSSDGFQLPSVYSSTMKSLDFHLDTPPLQGGLAGM